MVIKIFLDMNHYRNFIKSIFLGVAIIMACSCEDDIDNLEELKLKRVLTPLGLKAFVRNQTAIELNWSLREGVTSYLVEFSEDSLAFNTIIHSETVLAENLPYRRNFFGDTRYSARVKAISSVESVDDSNWATVTIRTNVENIFLPLPGQNVQDTYAILNWPAGSDVTRFVINPGNIERSITDEEKAEGEATIEGLSGSTDYTVTLYSGTKVRGTISFSTQQEANVFPTDDLVTIVANAESGARLVLAPGTYTTSLTITKPITIEGQKDYDMPVIKGNITLNAPVTSIVLKNLIYDGSGSIAQFINAQSGADIGSLSITGCEVANFRNSIISSTSTSATAIKFGTILISGSYFHDFLPADGGDGLDFRGGVLTSLAVENSTFAKGFRNFMRMQIRSNVSFRRCTFYKISTMDNSNNNGLFRMNKTAGGTFEVRNSLFAETGILNPTAVQSGNWCRQDSFMVDLPVYANNNIFSCFNLLVGLYTTPGQVGATELNPGFVNAANGDYTITNQTLIDNEVGDPRWR